MKTKVTARLGVKLKNRRVMGRRLSDKTTAFSFKKLNSDREVVTDQIRLTDEAVKAMMALLLKFQDGELSASRKDGGK